MLEIPEAHTLARQLTETLQGKTVKDCVANASPHSFAWFTGDYQEYPRLLEGKCVLDTKAFARLVEIQLEDNLRITFGDGANIRFFDVGEKLPKKHQLHLTFDDDSSLVVTIQMYGSIAVCHEGDQDDNFYYIVTKQKPEPLFDAFHKAYFDELITKDKQSISAKAFLATEQRIPGIGNGVTQDILFRAGIHPKTKLEKLDREKRDALYLSLKQTIFDMTANGGRDTEKDLFGCHGGYKTILSSKTWKQPCPVCGDTIVRQAYLGGNIYFCPTCQPLIK